MSLKPETFYALACDFPECGELYEGDGEYTYYADGPDYGDAAYHGWYVEENTGVAFCAAHTVAVECPPGGMVVNEHDAGYDDEYCQWCEDHATDTHLAPMEATWENRLIDAVGAVTRRAHRELDRITWRVTDRHGELGGLGRFKRKHHEALRTIWERTCRGWKPDITPQELFELERAIR